MVLLAVITSPVSLHCEKLVGSRFLILYGMKSWVGAESEVIWTKHNFEFEAGIL